MRISISGRHIDVGEALKTHVSEQLNAIVSKYAGRPIEAGVTFAHDAHEYLCETTVHLSTGLHAQAKSRDVEIYAAFDSCCEKMEKQLRRHKRRLKKSSRASSQAGGVFRGDLIHSGISRRCRRTR